MNAIVRASSDTYARFLSLFLTLSLFEQNIAYVNGTIRNPSAASFSNSSSLTVTFPASYFPTSTAVVLRITENFATNDSLRAAMPVRSCLIETFGSGPR